MADQPLVNNVQFHTAQGVDSSYQQVLRALRIGRAAAEDYQEEISDMIYFHQEEAARLTRLLRRLNSEANEQFPLPQDRT